MATVLVVEDAPCQLELINSFLIENRHTVIKAYDAKDGMSKAITHRLDAIITDVVMPEISGFEFCRQLKRNPATQKVPIIICSSKNQPIDRIWGIRQGAADAKTGFCLLQSFRIWRRNYNSGCCSLDLTWRML